METQQIKPSGWFYVLGLAVFLFGCLAAGVVFGVGVAGMVDSAIEVDRVIGDFDRLVVPGSAQLALDKAGSYAIFYEHRSVVDGVPFYSSPSRPQVRCDMQFKASGERVPLTDAWYMDSNYEMPSRAGTLLMLFDVDRPDTYVLSCDYAGSRDGPEVVLAVGTGLLGSAIELAVSVVSALAVPALLILGAGTVAALIVAIVSVLRHRSARRVAEEAS
jgi:hypothetical protein